MLKLPSWKHYLQMFTWWRIQDYLPKQWQQCLGQIQEHRHCLLFNKQASSPVETSLQRSEWRPSLSYLNTFVGSFPHREMENLPMFTNKMLCEFPEPVSLVKMKLQLLGFWNAGAYVLRSGMQHMPLSLELHGGLVIRFLGRDNCLHDDGEQPAAVTFKKQTARSYRKQKRLELNKKLSIHNSVWWEAMKMFYYLPYLIFALFPTSINQSLLRKKILCYDFIFQAVLLILLQ